MFDKDAIKALQEAQAITAAAEAMRHAEESNYIVTLPSDFKQHDLETYLQTRRRARGCMDTSVMQDFADYTGSHAEAGASVFVDVKSMSATAVLNLGSKDMPGHADNLARIKLQATAAYAALMRVATGSALSQLATAEFLEDWADIIQCYSEGGDDGEGHHISKPQATAAIRKLSVEALRKTESSVQALSVSRSAFESVQVASGSTIPTTLYVTCEPYQGLASRVFVLRLGLLTGTDKPAITLRIVKQELHAEEMAKEFAELATDALERGIPVLIGSYTAAK